MYLCSFFRTSIFVKAVLIAFVSLMMLLPGCRPGDFPPGAGRDIPEMPQEIESEEGQEPVISVYIEEDDEVVEMPMEEYIAGVVAGEMKPDWPVEALAAQAIIARTFTLQKIAETGGVPHRGAHASTDIEEFQAYSSEDITSQVRTAVEQTRGEVASHEGQFIRAWFSAYAGPKTALADEGLDFEEGNPPYIHSVDNPGEEIVPDEERDWRESFDLEEFEAAVKEVTGNDPGSIEDISTGEKGPSGRALYLLVNGEEVSAPSLRLSLGSTEMRSSLLTELELEEDRVIMAGRGFGHGVGLCQWGARAMAEQGAYPEDIVSFFYQDIQIVEMWE